MARFVRISILLCLTLFAMLTVGCDKQLSPVSEVEYSLGGQLIFKTPTDNIPVELAAAVYYPTDLSKGPYPLIIILHGQHVTC